MEETEVVEGQEVKQVEVAQPTGEETQVAAETPEQPPEPSAREKALQAELTRVRAKNRELEAVRQPASAPAAELESQGDFIPPGYPAEPQLNQFDDYDLYNRALVRWEAGRLIATEKHQTAQQQVLEARKAVVNTHEARIEAAKATKYTDWDEAVAGSAEIRFAEDAISAVMESEQSVDIAYHLFKHPEEVHRINGLSKVQQIKEITRLEDRFKGAQAPPPKRISQAPTPVNPIGGNDVHQKDPDKMTDAEWLAYERARVGKLGRRY
jgi:hypothetical protein